MSAVVIRIAGVVPWLLVAVPMAFLASKHLLEEAAELGGGEWQQGQKK
jgi:hypothetical protein